MKITNYNCKYKYKYKTNYNYNCMFRAPTSPLSQTQTRGLGAQVRCGFVI